MTGTVLRGGEVFDPDKGAFETRDLRWVGGRISADPVQPGDRVIDAAGCIVTPGLVDLHTHVFAGQDLGVSADETAFASGTTTLVDAGSAGAHLFGAFRSSVLERSRASIRALLNIATIGTTSIRLGGELRAPWYSSEQDAIEAIEANRDMIVGVKVRASADVGGEHAIEALQKARRVADAVDLPLMVHLGPPPVGIEEILSALGPGDVLTHAFTGWRGNTLLNEAGAVRGSVREAVERGVALDVGHGASGFSLEVARSALAQGIAPHTISTDLHAYSRDAVVDLPTVLSKFLALGLDLALVLAAATRAPARLIGSAAGTLSAGAVADVAVLESRAGQVTFTDGFGGHIEGTARLHARMTVCGGDIVHDRRHHE